MWQLIKVTDTEWIQDASGYYTYIHHVSENIVRLDWMDKNDMPVISFQGTAENVRKHAVRWIDSKVSQKTSLRISCEHASYIGRELCRAELLKENYVQD